MSFSLIAAQHSLNMDTESRRHLAGLVFFLLIADSQMSPLPANKFSAKIKDGLATTLANKAKSQPVPTAAAAATATADQAPAASDHGHLGRVQIKVYRGPDDHHHHAPYGYWVKQPADDAPHHH